MRLGLSERAAWIALWALILTPLVGFLPRLLGSADPVPAELQSPWMNQLLITAGRWPLESGRPALEGPALESLVARSTGVLQGYAPSYAPGPAAAGLLSGLWPLRTGVLAEGDRLARGTWTLASAARRKGSHTAAFLEAPLVSETGLEGFDELVESPGLGPAGLADALVSLWAAHPDEEVFAWVHLTDAGPRGSAVEALLERLEAAPGGLDERRRSDTMILLTALGSDGAIGEDDDSGFRVPLYLEFPADFRGGRHSKSTLSLIDVPEVICESAKLQRPLEAFDARPEASAAFLGVEVPAWVLLLGPDGHCLRRSNQRVTAAGLPLGPADSLAVWRVGPAGQDRGFKLLSRGRADGAFGSYRQLMGTLLPGLLQGN